MTLAKLLVQLKELEAQGYGDKTVYYRRASSGDCGELHHPRVSDHVEDSGPFDEEGSWVEISAGH